MATRRGGERRALSAAAGGLRRFGEASAAHVLEQALQASRTQQLDRFTHGFHSYPARMHPAIAQHVIEHLSQPGERVLDPFCGSGTVVLEAMLAGRRAMGSDLNPLALRIAEVQCSWRDADSRRRFTRDLHAVCERSTERVQARVAVRAKLGKAECTWYAPQVLKELAGLMEEIQTVRNNSDRRAMEVLFSAIVVKFSMQRSDTSITRVEKRIRKGLPTEFFGRRGLELVERWAALDQAIPEQVYEPQLRLGDARKLGEVFDSRAALLLSSPPYGGTYDYQSHHARRYPWLGLPTEEFGGGEIGARRNLSRADGAAKRWDRELGAVLSACKRALDKSGRLVFLIGDAQLGRTRVDAVEQLTRLAPTSGLKVAAGASWQREDYQGGPPRREHLLLLK